jgi:hypothetical protein
MAAEKDKDKEQAPPATDQPAASDTADEVAALRAELEALKAHLLTPVVGATELRSSAPAPADERKWTHTVNKKTGTITATSTPDGE